MAYKPIGWVDGETPVNAENLNHMDEGIKSSVRSINGIAPDENGNVEVAAGKDGTSVTVKSVSESTADGGSNVVTFSDGKTVTIKNGSKGSTGAPGYTPVKGVDYFDGKDGKDGKDGIDATPVTPLFVNTIEECTDTTKLYVLPDGYIYAYMMTEVTEEVITYTNRLPLSVDSNGNPYNGGKGWKADTRLNSSGVEASYTGIECTGFIPVKRGDIIRFKNFGFVPDGEYKSQQYTSIYDSNKTKLVSFISNVISGTYPDYGGVERDEAGNMILLKTDAIPIDGSAAQPEHEAFAFPENTAFVRFSAEEITDATIITVNEEIATTIVTHKEFAWANTGHAFVPADYEERIIAVEATAEANKESVESHEARIADLERGAVAGIPDYVITEAESVIDRVIAAQGNNTFTFAAITDMHYGNGGHTDGVIHACQAMKYIDSRIKLDAVAVLGDYTDGLAASAYDGAIADYKDINSVLDSLRFAPNFRVQGNHDFYAKHSPVLYRCIPAYSDDVVWGSRLGGYFYRDFEPYKLRVICLNTAEENKDGVSCTAEQYNWFATALDLSGKANSTDWQTLILSHHPLDWFYSNNSGYVFWQILNAYLNGTIWNGFNFAGKNSAKIVGNIHGHIHNLLSRKIAAGQPNTTESTINVVRIATPEACYGRPNSYNGSWEYNPFGEDTSYPKTQGTAEDTAFCIYCVDLDAHTVKAICYGAGYDREISY